MAKSMKLGGGGRFQKLENSLSKRPGVTDPGALAASIGRKKYGAEKMSEMSAKGRAREAKKDSPIQEALNKASAK